MKKPFFYHLLLVLTLLASSLSLAQAEEAPPPIAIGFYMTVIRDVPRKDVEISLRFWVEELGRNLNLNYKPVRLYDHWSDMEHDLKDGKINFIIAPSMGIVQHFPLGELADGFSGYINVHDELLLVVRREANIVSPADLAGKRVLLLEDDELSDIYLETLLMKAGMRSDLSQLGKVSREPRSNRQINQLFFGQSDASLVYRGAYETALALNPQIGERLQVLNAYTFKILSHHTGLFSAQMDPADRERITQAAMTIDKTPRGRQVLEIYHSDQMARTSVKDLIPYRELLETHRNLKKSENAHKKH